MDVKGIVGLRLLLMLPLLLVLAFCPKAQTAAQSGQASNEIRQLIDAVANSGCTFIRNGTEHTANAAADHLKLKWRRGKKHADTAEDFINNLASKSSWTGKPYSIKCPNQPEQTSADWLAQKLTQIRNPSSPP